MIVEKRITLCWLWIVIPYHGVDVPYSSFLVRVNVGNLNRSVKEEKEMLKDRLNYTRDITMLVILYFRLRSLLKYMCLSSLSHEYFKFLTKKSNEMEEVRKVIFIRWKTSLKLSLSLWDSRIRPLPTHSFCSWFTCSFISKMQSGVQNYDVKKTFSYPQYYSILHSLYHSYSSLSYRYRQTPPLTFYSNHAVDLMWFFHLILCVSVHGLGNRSALIPLQFAPELFFYNPFNTLIHLTCTY